VEGNSTIMRIIKSNKPTKKLQEEYNKNIGIAIYSNIKDTNHKIIRLD
jgi:uncharacterized protein YktA (UPF0223 family)